MPLYFQRPENALKRANEFIDVGEKQWALDALYDVIKSRKHRTWQKIHEPIMMKYLELCIDLKKSHVAKEGLFQYRNICQQVNIKSLEDVIRGYLQLAEEKTEAAREESQQAVVDIDDLDQIQTPESLLLSAVSSEDTKDRTDRVVLIPWLKFMVDSYRQCLELLRNNSRVERLYHDIAQQAFKFCLKYSRKTEFRKLCDCLRAHLGHINKYQNQQTSVNLNNPESQAMQLETRLVLLDSSVQLELWQEAYKAIEDIHGLMNLSTKAPNPRLMANYYQKLSLVFWKSNNYLFHAAALFRLFHLSREQKKSITSDEILKMAARVVLATLAIPMPANRTEIDLLIKTDENVIDKKQRQLSTLLGLSSSPSRSQLVNDLVRFGIIQCAPVQLQDLYRWLETEFHPLELCDHVQQSFDFLNKWEEFPELRQYIPSIQDITVVRLVKQISQVYQTLSFARLLELVPFAQSFNLEYLIIGACRRNDLQVRIDHKRECLHFGSESNVFWREEVNEGPHLQNMPNEQMYNQLVLIDSVLRKAVNNIQCGKMKKERKELGEEIVKAYKLTSSKDHVRLLSRQQIIENRKEMLENINYQKEVEEQKILENKKQKLLEAEKERMARETEERMKQRLLKEQTELKRKVVMEKIEQMKKTELGLRIFEGMDEGELEKLDPDDLLNKQVEQLEREKKELQTKLHNQERKVDHLERAKRIEEIALLQAESKELKMKDVEFWELHENERIEAIKEERALAVQSKNRLIKLKEEADKFQEFIKQTHLSIYQKKLTEFKKVLDEEWKKRLAERKLKRREERRAVWLKEREEKRQREIDEMRKREREEELAKLEEIEAKKRAKEREVEEKLRRDQENAELERKKERVNKEDPAKNWREREQEKRSSWAPKKKSDESENVAANDYPQDWRKCPEKVERKVPIKREAEDGLSQNQENAALERKKEEKVSGGLLATNWRDREQEKRQIRAPQEKSENEAASNYPQDWRKRSNIVEEREPKLYDRERSDDWRKRDKPKEVREDRSWRRDDRASSYQNQYFKSDRDGQSEDRKEPERSDWRSGASRSKDDREPRRFGDKGNFSRDSEAGEKQGNKNWRGRDGNPESGSWRDVDRRFNKDDHADNHGPKNDAFKKDRDRAPHADADGFMRVRRYK